MNKPTILNAVVMGDEFLYYFEEDKMGMAADVAYLELVELSWDFLRGKLTAQQWLDQQLGFIFGFDGIKDFNKAIKRYNKRIKELKPQSPNMDFTPISPAPTPAQEVGDE